METKTNGEVSQMTQEGSNFAGWLFRLIQEGWLRKRWRKRWCVVRNEKMYLYEIETSQDSDKTCGFIDLKNYHKCIHASKKECKKSPHTIILEVSKGDEKSPKNKSGIKSSRELFYADSKDERDRWYEKLNETIAIARMGGGKNLDHVTKTRAKPAGNRRRPPTRAHLRERATQSMYIPGIEEPEAQTAPTKRGHQPTSAIKPPPPSGASKSPQPLPRKKMASASDIADVIEEPYSHPPPPPPPSKALKPKLVRTEDEEAGEEEAGDSEQETAENATSVEVEERSLSPSSLEIAKISSAASSRGSSLAGSTKSLDRSELVRSAPASFTNKLNGAKDTRTMLLKTQAQKAQLLFPDPEDSDADFDAQGKSKSMVMLDTIDDDLPPPPDLPPHSFSDVEAKPRVKVTKKKKKQKKTDRKKRSRSNEKLVEIAKSKG